MESKFEIRYGDSKERIKHLKNIETLKRAKELSDMIEDFAIRHKIKWTIAIWEEFKNGKYWLVQSFET